MGTRRITAALLIAAGLTAAGPAQGGEVERFKTRVTISDRCTDYSNQPVFNCRSAPRAQRNYRAVFSGRVKSRESKCERRRKLVLFRQDGKAPTYSQHSTVKSKPNGSYKFVIDNKPGFVKYFVRAKGVRKGDIVCKGDSSRLEQHGGP